MSAILEVNGLTKQFGGLVALRNVNLSVREGSIHAVIGPNGSGKTTLFNIISGVYTPTSGSVSFMGRPATRLHPEKLAAMGLGRTFQNTRLFRSMTVIETVIVVLHRSGWAWTVSREDRRRAMDILEFVGLADRADAETASLPQGQRRLLEIAKVLALDPKLILLDEPHGGLNHTETARLIEVIREISRRGHSLLLIEHEMDVVMQLAHEITVLNFGQRLATGTPQEIQGNDAVVEAYLGQAAPSIANAAPAVETAPLLQVRDLSVRFGDIEAVRNVNLDVGAGELVCLLGNNGAGKSTTLKAISRMVPASDGSVTFDGQPLLRKRAEDLVGMGVALVPEQRRLFGGLIVLDNLRIGAHGRPRAYVDEVMEEVLDIFPSLRRLQRSLAFSLSGGEQQMLAIGRALMSRPRLLMLDEPSLGLAPKLVDQVFAKLVEVNARGTAILLIEQNARMALSMSHRAYVLGSGRVVASGGSAQLLGDERVKNAYLGIGAEAAPHADALVAG